MIPANRAIPFTYRWYHGADISFTIPAPSGVVTGDAVIAVIRRIGDPDQNTLVSLNIDVSGSDITLSKDYEDVSFLRKGRYELSVEAQNYGGPDGPSPWRMRGFFVVGDEIETTSSAPGWIIAVPMSPTEIDVSWAAAPLATSYELERSLDQETWVPVYAGSDTNFNNTGLTTALTYYYRVKALRPGFPDSIWMYAVATTPSSGSGLVSVFRYTQNSGSAVTINAPALIGTAPLLAFRGVSGEMEIITSGTPSNDEILINTATGDITFDVSLPLSQGERITIVYTVPS